MNIPQGIKNIAVLGAGSWGTAAATLLCRNNHNVTLWSRDTEKIAVVANELENKEYLPGVKLDERMNFTDDISCVKNKDMVVMVTPSSSIRSMARQISGLIDSDTVIVVLAKGLEQGTYMTMHRLRILRLSRTRLPSLVSGC